MPTTNWSSTRLDDKMDLAVLDHGFSSNLVQAAANGADPPKRLYDYLVGRFCTSTGQGKLWQFRRRTATRVATYVSRLTSTHFFV
ncbi:hypothetical protein F4782DRAFT_523990 [Xylaria castorea]|nr:hypothetical protein F4782DRAFT_523990 [Xylaria castorea]